MSIKVSDQILYLRTDFLYEISLPFSARPCYDSYVGRRFDARLFMFFWHRARIFSGGFHFMADLSTDSALRQLLFNHALPRKTK